MTDEASSFVKMDSYLYRHKLSEIMSSPVQAMAPSQTVGDAIFRMVESSISALIIASDDGQAIGIITERDILRTINNGGAEALSRRLVEIMSTPVETVPSDAFLYRALARMTRLSLRHLLVCDSEGRPVGMVTGRAMLKVRASEALVIGDDVATAESSEDLKRAHRRLTTLARSMLVEGAEVKDIAAVISSVVRDMTRRAAELVEAELSSDGWGSAPVPYALLVLGSAGRGESLLAFDQDNAIVFKGGKSHDNWFAEFGNRLNILLNEAGIPFCNGNVMARNPAWRRSLETWKTEISNWVFSPEPQTLMNTDIFFDFVAVHGDHALAEELKNYAIEMAGRSALFLKFLSMHVSEMGSPTRWFGLLVMRDGKINIKKYGLLPLTAAARVKAIRAGIAECSTLERFNLLTSAGKIHPDDLRSLTEAHEIVMRLLLQQQLDDLAKDLPASAFVRPKKLVAIEQYRLSRALKRIGLLRYSMI